MKTDDLISVLAADTLPQTSVEHRLRRAVPVASVLAAGALLALWGIRPDIGAALGSAAVLKSLVPLVLALIAGALAVALSRPGMSATTRLGVLGLFAVTILAAFTVFFAREGMSGLTGAMDRPTLLVCLTSIPALALPFLGAGLWSLSAGATLRPRLSGAMAGLVAGGAGAALYALYCVEDAPLFVFPAYSVAIGLVALTGALIGPRVLKW